jgi:hypothetical protein
LCFYVTYEKINKKEIGRESMQKMKFKFFTWLAIVLTAGTLAITKESTALTACQRKEFHTQMVKEACLKGGQEQAKDAMKRFDEQKGIKSCNQCHDKLAPTYSLKSDGLLQFQHLGGK